MTVLFPQCLRPEKLDGFFKVFVVEGKCNDIYFCPSPLLKPNESTRENTHVFSLVLSFGLERLYSRAS